MNVAGCRGLWFDKQLGNLLKVDQHERILQCYHGFRKLTAAEVERLYPGSIQRRDPDRVFVINTGFNLPETFLIAALIDHFTSKPDLVATDEGWVRRVDFFAISIEMLKLRNSTTRRRRVRAARTALSHFANYFK